MEKFTQNFNKDGAKDLLRVEVQCKKSKTNIIKVKNVFDSRYLEHYLSQEISCHYNKIIGSSDYYTLSEIIKIVQDSNSPLRLKRSLRRLSE